MVVVLAAVKIFFNCIKVQSDICQFIQYNMTQTKLQIKQYNLQPAALSSSTRRDIIDKFLLIKQKSPTLNRETIFTALAVYQKYFLSRAQGRSVELDFLLYQDLLIAVCLWISTKIQSYEKSFLQKILQLHHIPIRKSQMIMAEAHILETIDYEIPLYHTYASMILQFNRRSQSNLEKNVQLVAQCLAFYGEAIKMSSDFVLEEVLGANIVTCLADRYVSDSRIRCACRQIRRNRTNKIRGVRMVQKGDTAIKVCE